MFGEGVTDSPFGCSRWERGCRPALTAGLLAKQDMLVVLFVCSLFPDASDLREGKSDTESMENMSLDGYRPARAAGGGR